MIVNTGALKKTFRNKTCLPPGQCQRVRCFRAVRPATPDSLLAVGKGDKIKDIFSMSDNISFFIAVIQSALSVRAIASLDDEGSGTWLSRPETSADD